MIFTIVKKVRSGRTFKTFKKSKVYNYMLLKIISAQKVRSERIKMTFLKNTKKARIYRNF